MKIKGKKGESPNYTRSYDRILHNAGMPKATATFIYH